MKVKELIKRLKKLDQNAEVGFQDHDADQYTISSWVHGAREINFDEVPEGEKADNLWDCTGIVVAIH